MRTPRDASSERPRERSGRSASPRARRKRTRRSPPCETAAPSGENGADARRRRKRGPRRMPHTPQGSATESTKQMRRYRRAPPMGGGGPSGENGADARRRRKRGPRRMPHTPQGSATESTKQMRRYRRAPPMGGGGPSGENGADARRRRKRGPRRMPHTPQGSATESTKQMRRYRRAPPMGGSGPERRERCRCEATTEARPEAYAAYAAGQRDGVNEADAPLSPLGVGVSPDDDDEHPLRVARPADHGRVAARRPDVPGDLVHRAPLQAHPHVHRVAADALGHDLQHAVTRHRPLLHGTDRHLRAITLERRVLRV